MPPVEMTFFELQLNPEQWSIETEGIVTRYQAKSSGLMARLRGHDGIWRRLVDIGEGKSFTTDGHGHANLVGLGD